MVYVLIFNPTKPLEIHGPFDTDAAASEFGQNWQRLNNDNPCWQVIENPTVIFNPFV